VSPRVREDSVHPRRLLGASGRPLNFTVSGPFGASMSGSSGLAERTKRVVLWFGIIGAAIPIFWGTLSFVFFNARESVWTDIYWWAVYVTCPPWLMPESALSWLITPLLNGLLYAGLGSLVSWTANNRWRGP